MKTKEEINEMVKQMVVAVCHGGFGRLQAMLGAKADKITVIKQKKYTTNDFIKGFQVTDKKFEPVIVKESEGLFADQVQEFFESTTGLRTCL